MLISLFAKCENDTPAESLPQDNNAVSWQGEQPITKPMVNNKPAIAIPGIKEVTFLAGQKDQKVNFYNPQNNDCYFQMNLYVDNEMIWQSGNVAPGDGYYNIKLNKVLLEGERQGYLLIKCYKKDGTELNSAKVKIKIFIIS